jgi:hypothetical protein
LHLKSNFKMNLNKSKSVFPPEAKTFWQQLVTWAHN